MGSSAQEIANLVYRYAELVDLGDFAGVGELFTYASVSSNVSPDVREGADAVRRQLEEWTRRHEDGTPRTKHLTTNLIIDVDEGKGRALCRSYYCVLQQVGALQLQPIAAGRYHDEFRRIGGVWWFTKRHYINEMVGDVSAHLLQRLV
ncbi:MAG TPA: nuclear transport factor 2 family protein [Deltaproteobacteria bacterium]|jgi:3-phenylpropionate/cinnamic acid dioxygenase small subunit|nr:nuclear transport factor 2 family protein [Deltaproteobacteria bacterium]